MEGRPDGPSTVPPRVAQGGFLLPARLIGLPKIQALLVIASTPSGGCTRRCTGCRPPTHRGLPWVQLVHL
nr:MAG TPA: Radical SAM superfamily [Caudoviricetes sp.]